MNCSGNGIGGYWDGDERMGVGVNDMIIEVGGIRCGDTDN